MNISKITENWDSAAEYLQSQIDKLTELSKRIPKVYGFHIDSTKSNPSEAVTYLADAVGMTPAYMDYTSGKFNYGSWEDAFFMPRPCMLNADGTVAYYLNPNDYTKKVDGTTSDVAVTTHSMNAMMEWGTGGKKIWVKKVADADDPYSCSVYISDAQIDEDYHAWSFIGTDGKLKEHFYTRIYMGAVVDNKMRSLSGLSPSGGKTASEEIEVCTANGNGWYTDVFCDIDLINDLLILIGKSLNTQNVFGKGNVIVNDMINNGQCNNKGLFYGSNIGKETIKVFGMENLWGNQWQRTAGLILDTNGIKIKKCYGTSDGSTTATYNLTSDGYISTGIIPTGSSGGYIFKMNFSNGMSIPNISDGRGVSYYGDGLWFNNDYQTYPLRGGSIGHDTLCGAFGLNLNDTYNSSGSGIGASLSYK